MFKSESLFDVTHFIYVLLTRDKIPGPYRKLSWTKVICTGLKPLIQSGLLLTGCENKYILTSLADEPETSIHVLEKNAQEPNMKMMYITACMGSSMM